MLPILWQGFCCVSHRLGKLSFCDRLWCIGTLHQRCHSLLVQAAGSRQQYLVPFYVRSYAYYYIHTYILHTHKRTNRRVSLKEKRRRRKARAHSPPEATYICARRWRACRSRIGMFRHERFCRRRRNPLLIFVYEAKPRRRSSLIAKLVANMTMSKVHGGGGILLKSLNFIVDPTSNSII